MPIGIATIQVRIRASTENISVNASRLPLRSETGVLHSTEKPQSLRLGRDDSVGMALLRRDRVGVPRLRDGSWVTGAEDSIPQHLSPGTPPGYFLKNQWAGSRLPGLMKIQSVEAFSGTLRKLF